ncbi:hypothetical protein LTS00_014669 [Friedmanniomyces endolithicus]|uniref:AAR2 N-terminal domain-containing protein n=1 Tax=Friedmanniomyces endolithicus TaxID=329885 RepID=A0AAN6J2B9_9PEZI|nr:hypothetical protein LTS00_014669 [Friedmanniomyces endolithicus]KAK0308231.1 hypothetical protein LTR82_015685 [Friedmanniomyces endolithicus]
MDTTASSALLILDLPEQALAGIDLLAFTTTPRFKGVKAIPPGLHLAFVGANTAFSERHGIWFNVPHGPVDPGPPLTITRWQSSSESLVTVTDEAEHLKWRANLGGIWREGLTPYRQTTAKTTDGDNEQEELVDWTKLTSHITETHLTRITGGKTWTLSSGSSAKRDLEDIPGLDRSDIDELQSDKELAFLPIDLKRTWRPGATGRERTEAAQDPLLGAERSHRTAHCRVADTGLIDLADEGGSLLKGLLTRFRTGLESLQGSIGVQDVVDELDDLEDYLRTEHGWQFGGTFAKSGVLELEDGEQVRMDTTAFDEEDEAGEYAPQVVELTAEQARMLGADVGGGEMRVEMNGLRAGMSRTSLHEVVDSSADDDEEEVEGEHKAATVGGSSESEGEEAADLEDMDARY